MKRFVVLAVVAVFMVPSMALSADIGPIDIAKVEGGVQKIHYVKKDKTIYNYSWKLKRDGKRVAFSAKGDNNKVGAKRIEWVENSVMELSGNSLRTLSWSKDSSGNEQESWKLTYDWQGRKMDYQWQNRKNGKKKSKTVKLGPKALSADAMYFMLRGFPFEKGKGTKIDGDFILTDGQALSAYIIMRGEKTITTPLGKIDTYKLEMKLKGALGPIAPKMYMWYTKSKPHLFVRYEGKENGLMKPRTANELIRYTPAADIKPVKVILPDQEAAPAADAASIK